MSIRPYNLVINLNIIIMGRSKIRKSIIFFFQLNLALLARSFSSQSFCISDLAQIYFYNNLYRLLK